MGRVVGRAVAVIQQTYIPVRLAGSRKTKAAANGARDIAWAIQDWLAAGLAASTVRSSFDFMILTRSPLRNRTVDLLLTMEDPRACSAADGRLMATGRWGGQSGLLGSTSCESRLPASRRVSSFLLNEKRNLELPSSGRE